MWWLVVTAVRAGEGMPERAWDFEHLELRVRVRVDEGRIEGQAIHTVSRLVEDARVVRLHQVGLHVIEVTVDGERVRPVVGDWLEVPVAGSESRHVIAISYTAEPQTGLHFRGGPGARPEERPEAWSQGESNDNRYWFPSWDHPSDKLTVRTTVEAPARLTAFANGVLEERREVDDGFVAWTYRLDRPIASYLVAIAVGDYEVYADDGPVRFEYVVQRGTGEDAARRTFERARDQLAFFADLLGEPYPYPVYRQLAVQGFLYGGMENAAFTVVNDHRLVTAVEGSSLRADTLVSHELVHQWFGNLLTCHGWGELWLNEGFATYYAARWQAHDQGPERAAELVVRWHQGALGDRVYLRGALVLHMLRVHLGDEVFDRAIRQYVAERRDTFVETDDLRRVLEEVSGRELAWFFDEWVGDGVDARLVSTHHWSGGRLEVRVVQESASILAQVEVEIGLADGGTRTERVWLGPAGATLDVPLPEPPRYVAMDPRGGVLADWDRQQSAAEWAAQATSADQPFARLVAIARLGRPPLTDDALATLARITGDGPVALRRAAATALGATRDARAIPALVALVDAGEPDLADVAAEGLGLMRLPTATTAGDSLQRATRGPVAPEVKAAALLSLAALEPGLARTTARAWLRRRDPTAAERLHLTAAEVLGRVGGASDLDLLIARIDERRWRTMAVVGSSSAAVQLAVERDPHDPSRIALATAIEPLLRSPNLRLRQAAIGWLARIGDSRSAAALETFASANLVTWEGLSSRAQEAAELIRSRVRPESPLLPDLERMRRELEAVERRREELER